MSDGVGGTAARDGGAGGVRVDGAATAAGRSEEAGLETSCSVEGVGGTSGADCRSVLSEASVLTCAEGAFEPSTSEDMFGSVGERLGTSSLAIGEGAAS